MYSTLTLDELYDFHTRLCAEHTARHDRMMILTSALSDQWALLDAAQRQTDEAAEAVYAEITRREGDVYDA